MLLGVVPPAPAGGTAPEATEIISQGDYRLGPGDLLSITVSGARNFDQSARVSNSGRIRIPYVGVMFVAEQTTLEVESEIASLIQKHELISEPSVRVQVEQYRSRPTYIIGEVNTPGQFVITGEMFLLDLISKAGGLLPGAAETAVLYRRSQAKPSVKARILGAPEIGAADAAAPPANQNAGASQAEPGAGETAISINLRELREGKRPELNVRLEGGDIFYVPRARPQNIWIIGDVKVPGGYTLPRRGQITAAQAVIYAGGPLPTAKMKDGFLMRHNAAGVREALPVDFAAIIDGRRPDIPVLPDDIIFIPNSSVKTVAAGLLTMLPRLLQQFIIF